jgi:hypothetical protein
MFFKFNVTQIPGGLLQGAAEIFSQQIVSQDHSFCLAFSLGFVAYCQMLSQFQVVRKSLVNFIHSQH